jgi:hypothetical protein
MIDPDECFVLRIRGDHYRGAEAIHRLALLSTPSDAFADIVLARRRIDVMRLHGRKFVLVEQELVRPPGQLEDAEPMGPPRLNCTDPGHELDKQNTVIPNSPAAFGHQMHKR